MVLPSIAVTTSPTWKPAFVGGAAGFDLVDARGRARLAEEREQAGEDHDRQHEIGDRTGGHDGRARSDLLVVETAGALFLGHAGERFGRRRRGLALVAEELHIAAERDRRNLPAGAMAVVEADQFRAEAERERQHLHAGPAGDQEVAELMEEYDDGQDEQEGDDVADEPMAQGIETIQTKTRTSDFPQAGPQALSPNI